MNGYNQNYYKDLYEFGYIQKLLIYNYAGYYQQPQYNYQQPWRQVSVIII